jgi:hypothetical protein
LSYKNCFGRIAGIASLLLSLTLAQAAMSQTRIAGAINNDERMTLKGTTSTLIAKSLDTGRMAGGQTLGRMLLLLTPSAEQEQAAEQLVGDLHDPSSTSYHKWLTPAQFGQQFGVSESDAAQVQQWLERRGLTVHEVSQSRRFIVFSGTVSQVQDAFSTEMHTYTYKLHGQDISFISNSTDIQIPAALQPVVKGVVRLHSDPRMPSAVLGGKIKFKKSPGHFTFGDAHYMTPADFAKIYNVQPLYDAGIDGSGQTIAIVSRSSLSDTYYGFDGLQDIRDFRSLVGLPANDPEVIVNGDDPQVNSFDDALEAMLDVTWAGAVAPMAHIKMVASQSNFADGVDVSAAYIVDHLLAQVMSTSFGSCEQNMGPVGTAFYNSLWQQAAAEGITSFVSSGDNGGAGCDSPGGGTYASGLAVNGIASTPYNVAVGGTQFDDTDNPSAYWSATNDPTTGLSALGYIPEKVWNESSNDPTPPLPSLWAGSGGVSTLYAKPNWQTAPGVPPDGKRDLPDISLSAAAHDGYLICFNGSCGFGTDGFYVLGGTSASSPAAAGIMALVNQKQAGQKQGIANYVLYKLASTPGVFHDTVKGDNKVPDANGQYTVGYSAAPGYDLATGLGSFDANALVNHWQSAASTLGSTTTLKLATGQTLPVVHGTPVTFNAAVKCSGASCKKPTGEVALMATSSTGDSVGVGVGQLTPGATASTSNIQSGTIPGGTYGVTARYSGDASYYSSTSTPAVQVTVTPEPSQTYVGVIGGGSYNITPVTVTYDEPLHLGFVVAGMSGNGYPSGQLTLQADGQPVQTVLANAVTPSPVILNYGEKSTLLTLGNIPGSQSSTISYLAPGLSAGTHQLQANYPGDNSFSSSTSPGSTSNTYTITITKATSFIADFFPDGTPVMNVPVSLIGQVGLNNFCAPFGGTITATDVTSGTPVPLGSGTLNTLYCDSYSFPATFTTPGLADPQCLNGSACRHIVRVDYSGDSNVKPATQTFTFFPVYANAPSNISLSADVSAAMAGNPVTLTALVTSDVRLHAVTGIVTFLDGPTTLGTAALDVHGNATLVATTLSGGPHNLVARYAGDAVIAGSDSSASPLMVTIMDYTMQGAPSALTIRDGQTGTATLSVFPLGGFSQAVQFSCGTLPAHVSCNFSQAQITPDGVHPSNVTLTVNTKGTLANNTGKSSLWAVTSTFALAGILLPFGKRKGWKISLAAMCLIVVGLYGGGCGSGSSSAEGGRSSAPAGNFSFTVSASSSGVTAAKTVTLTVNIVK